MAQSKAELTPDKQILYLVQWFAEFSDFQRGDFLNDHLVPLYGPFLKSEILLPQTLDLNGNGETVEQTLTNGVGAIDLSSNNEVRPPSIFQCRMKLFHDWFVNWSENDRLELLLRLRNIDSLFLNEFYRVFLHKNSINTPVELEQRLKPESAELLTRLDITEKVFESKLPELLMPASPGYDLTTPKTNSTPDLLTDVVGIKNCDSMETDPSSLEQSSSITTQDTESAKEEVVEEEPIVVEADDQKTETKPEVDDHITELGDDYEVEGDKSGQAENGDVEETNEGIIEEEADSPLQMITGPTLINVSTTSAPPDLVA